MGNLFHKHEYNTLINEPITHFWRSTFQHSTCFLSIQVFAHGGCAAVKYLDLLHSEPTTVLSAKLMYSHTLETFTQKPNASSVDISCGHVQISRQRLLNNEHGWAFEATAVAYHIYP